MPGGHAWFGLVAVGSRPPGRTWPCWWSGRSTTSSMTTATLGWWASPYQAMSCHIRQMILTLLTQDGTTNIPGYGVNIDFEASVEHYPSIWQVTVKQTNKHLTKNNKRTPSPGSSRGSEVCTHGGRARCCERGELLRTSECQNTKLSNTLHSIASSPVHHFTKTPFSPLVQTRNITFELCAWGFGNVETFGPSMGHLWRTRWV